MGRRGGQADAWSGQRVMAIRERMRRTLPQPCGKCGLPVRPGQPFVVGHVVDRWARPDLTWEPSNHQPEHRSCSDRSGQAAEIAKAKAEALRDAGIDPSFPAGPGPGNRRPPSRTHTEPPGVRPELTWPVFRAEAPEWLGDVLELPGDASPPLATTPVHPRSAGTYGPEACDWIERELARELPRGLRWWQRYAVYRTLEHDASGALVWRTVLESAPRRSGKSVRLRAMALWRVSHPELFGGEAQLVIHTGRDVAVVREIHRKAWNWAEERRDGGWKVSKGVGQEEVVKDGVHRWVVRSTGSVYGYDATNPYIDEAWDVDPIVFTDGLEPSTLERVSPQSVLTSTANRRATSLMKTRLSSALAAEDYSTLLMLWAAPSGSDPGDPDAWRAASPYWSDDRHELISAAHARAEAGESEPEADDPDPMADFASNYLNLWDLRGGKRAPAGKPVVEEAAWGLLEAAAPAGPPDAVAVEGWFSDGVSVARAWRRPGGVTVSVTDHPDVASAAASAAAAGCRRPVLVGKSLTSDPAVAAVWHEPAQGTTRAAVQDLSRLVGDGLLLHDGSGELASQVLALRTQPGADGPRVVSKERADAVKALVWSAEAARSHAEMPMIF